LIRIPSHADQLVDRYSERTALGMQVDLSADHADAVLADGE
jgi:hypothetical protein